MTLTENGCMQAAPQGGTRLFVWGARALYIGPAFGLSAHRNAVAVLAAGLGGRFGVSRDPRSATAGSVSCSTALIPANTLHQLEIATAPMAFLYLDAHSAELKLLRSAMCADHGRFAAGIANEALVLEALAAVAAGKLDGREAREAVQRSLGLPSPAPADERIAQALRRMRAKPGEAHTLESLAADTALSTSRFLHLFKQATGVPLRRYRIWNRMGAAVVSIAAGRALTDAALEAGFSSSAHFSAAFREMFGMAPGRLAAAGLKIEAGAARAG